MKRTVYCAKVRTGSGKVTDKLKKTSKRLKKKSV